MDGGEKGKEKREKVDKKRRGGEKWRDCAVLKLS